MKKIDRALYGPGLGEIILGASLSVVLGVVLGIAMLVFKPVATVKEIPKDAPSDAVYYIAGPRGSSNSSALNLKRKKFTGGESVSVSEEELNALSSQLNSSSPIKASKPVAAGAKPDAAAPESDLLTVGAPNFRLRDDRMQVVVPVKVSLLGFDQDVLVQTRGPLVKRGDHFAYDPEMLWIGSCPAGRLPGVTGLVIRKVLLAKPLPDDISEAWGKLVDASIVGKTLNLTMP